MKAIIVGGGIGGLTTALMLRARGIDCELFEQADTHPRTRRRHQHAAACDPRTRRPRPAASSSTTSRSAPTCSIISIAIGQEVWQRNARHRCRPRRAAVLDPPRPAAKRDPPRRRGAAGRGCHPHRLQARRLHPGRGRRDGLFLRPHRQPHQDGARRYPDRRRRHSFAGARDAVSERRARRAGTG